MKPSSYIAGTGHNLPKKIIPNEYFTTWLETSDEWIQERTGIRERRWVEKHTTTSELAEPACQMAMEKAEVKPNDINAIICGTVTPDYVFPSTACMLQKRLGILGFAFDLNAVCSGFLYSLVMADSLIANDLADTILVVGADIYSQHLINKKDRSTVILFGDGAGAIVLKRTEKSNNSKGILCSKLYSDGNLGKLLLAPLGTAMPLSIESLQRGDHNLRMEGRDIFKLAVRNLTDATNEVLKMHEISIHEIDHMISHQANLRILQAVAKSLKLPEEKVHQNIEYYGNTSAATIPILLSELMEDGKIKAGDKVVFSAFGGGLTWGAILAQM